MNDIIKEYQKIFDDDYGYYILDINRIINFIKLNEKYIQKLIFID